MEKSGRSPLGSPSFAAALRVVVWARKSNRREMVLALATFWTGARGRPARCPVAAGVQGRPGSRPLAQVCRLEQPHASAT